MPKKSSSVAPDKETAMVRITASLRDRAAIVAKRKRMTTREVLDTAVEEYVKKHGE